MIKKVNIYNDNGKIRLRFRTNKLENISTGLPVGKLNEFALRPVIQRIEHDLNNDSLAPIEVYKQLAKIFGKSRFSEFRNSVLFPNGQKLFEFLWFCYKKKGFQTIQFDKEYKLTDTFTLNALKIYKENPEISEEIAFIQSFKTENVNEVTKADNTKDYSDSFKNWARDIKQATEYNAHYMNVYNYLKKKGKIDIAQLPLILNQETTWSNSTYNRYKLYLCNFCDYLVKKGLIIENPLTEIANKAVIKKTKDERLPLTIEQVRAILNALKNDTYIHKFAPIKDSFYYPYIAFLAYTGARPSEAAALTVKDIDFKKNYITINKALGHKQGLREDGTNSRQTLTKDTKNGKERNIPFSKDLLELLEKQVKDKKQNDLIFPNKSNNHMDFDNIQKRILPKIWEKTKIDKRDLYCFRHSFISHLVEKKIPFAQIAYLVGDTIRTIQENYTHLVKEVTKLPKLY